MRDIKRWLVLLLALAMIAAACSQGGDDGDAGDDTTTTEAESGGDTTTTEAMEETTTTAGGGDDMEVVTDGVTVTDDTIYVGMLADLSGPFATLVKDIVDAELVAFDNYNAAGGLAGQWEIEVLVEDTGYDVTVHNEKYAELKDKVVGFTQSTGSPHTASIAPLLVEDNLFAIPLSWYSGWADPTLGENVLEQGPSYCIEAMSVVQFHSERFEADNGVPPTWAVVSLPGEYGQDGAAGAKYAIDNLGLELVYDGEGAAAAEGNTEVIQALVDAQPDMVFVTLTPSGLAEIFGGATQQGLTEAIWSGSGPSFNFALLQTPIGNELANRYFHSGYYAPYGTDVEGMDEIVAAMTEAYPDRILTDAFTRGFIEAKIMIAALEAAYAAGDLTPAGVTSAAKSIETIDFGGLIPGGSQTWAGEPNDYIPRAIQVYKPVENFEPNTIASGEGLAFEPIDTNYEGSLAAEFDYQGPCFVAEG